MYYIIINYYCSSINPEIERVVLLAVCYVTGTENFFLSAWVKCLGVNMVIQAIYCHHRWKMRNHLYLPLIRDPSIGLEKTTRQTLARMMVLSMQLSKSLRTPYILSQCKLSPLNLVDDKVHMAQWSKFVHLSDLPRVFNKGRRPAKLAGYLTPTRRLL